MFLILDNGGFMTDCLSHYASMLGHSPLVVRRDDPKKSEYAADPSLSHVCLSSGCANPAHDEDMLSFLHFLATRRTSVPVLGIGLGCLQLTCFAAGRTVFCQRYSSGGKLQIAHTGGRIFAGVETPFQAACYDFLVPSKPIPGMQVTATYQERSMAFEHESLPWTGILFHPESLLTPSGFQIFSNFAGSGQTNGREHFFFPEQGKQPGAHPIPIPEIIDTLGNGEDLSPEATGQIFLRLMRGEVSPAQAGAILLALRAKGETAAELAAAARAVLACAVTPRITGNEFIDVVGTGGDGKNSFNCSTGTSLVLAALGHKVVKHGNRSASSKSGSADVLERLGFPLYVNPEDVETFLHKRNFVFLFAPYYHPSFQRIMPVRKDLGVRTLFNVLGPLVNPAMPKFRLVGVAQERLLPLMAGALAELGDDTRAAVVFGAGGFDELTPLGPAKVVFVMGKELREVTIDPVDFGFSPCKEEELAITGPQDGEKKLRQLLSGDGPKGMQSMLILNVGLGLHVLRGGELKQCMEEAKQAVTSGIGREILYA